MLVVMVGGFEGVLFWGLFFQEGPVAGDEGGVMVGDVLDLNLVSPNVTGAFLGATLGGVEDAVAGGP